MGNIPCSLNNRVCSSIRCIQDSGSIRCPSNQRAYLLSWWWRMIGSTLRKDRGAQIRSPLDCVLLHDFSFLGSQWSGFKQDALRHGQLADIVYETASAQSEAQVLRQSQFFPQRDGRFRKTVTVPFGAGILRLDRQRKTRQHHLGVIQLIGVLLQAQQGPNTSQQFGLIYGLVEEIINGRRRYSNWLAI
jgi:hypothetical protein